MLFEVRFSEDFTRNRERLLDVCALIEQKAKDIRFVQSETNKQFLPCFDVREIISESVKEVFGEYCMAHVFKSEDENKVFYVVRDTKFMPVEF